MTFLMKLLQKCSRVISCFNYKNSTYDHFPRNITPLVINGGCLSVKVSYSQVVGECDLFFIYYIKSAATKCSIEIKT